MKYDNKKNRILNQSPFVWILKTFDILSTTSENKCVQVFATGHDQSCATKLGREREGIRKQRQAVSIKSNKDFSF